MNRILLVRGDWKIVYRDYCYEYNCSRNVPAVDLEGPITRHTHIKTVRYFGKPRTELDIVASYILLIHQYELNCATEENKVAALASAAKELADDMGLTHDTV